MGRGKVREEERNEKVEMRRRGNERKETLKKKR